MAAPEWTPDQYHASVAAGELDVLNLTWPRLRQPRHYTHVPCASLADCFICRPLSPDTLEGLRGYATKMFRLMTGKAAAEHAEEFKANRWCLDIASALKTSSIPAHEGNKTPGPREKVERLRTLALICDAVHTPEFLVAAASYRAICDQWERERKQAPAAGPDETQEAAQTDLSRIRAALRAEWEAIKGDMDQARMQRLLYVATVWGMGQDDSYAPLRTDWWRASYKKDHGMVAGLDKEANWIELTDDAVTLHVPRCSKEPGNSVTLDVSKDSPLLADVLRAYAPLADEKNDGLLFTACKRTGHDGRRTRAMIRLLRPPGECPHAGQCTRCHETFKCGKNGKRECQCTAAGKRSRPECGSWCGTACGHYTAIDARHKRVCSSMGSRTERSDLAARMGTSTGMLSQYGDGIGSV